MTLPVRPEKQFGLALAFIVAVIALWPLVDGPAPSWPWLLACLILLLVSWQRAEWLSPVMNRWLRLGHFLGMVNTRLLLGAAFFLVITPLAWVFKLLRRDPLKLRSQTVTSYWLTHNKQWSSESFKNQF